ncbi:homoprotocatechuate degradation operon regulator HpaR [Rhodovulum sp. DZ06]|uniref:homoprotocatechuate degradation operon regulator HpaR n=1 Tax=Rhodovulum sp. DZ06 TaxID=3425126 RepID=UPI003D358249
MQKPNRAAAAMRRDGIQDAPEIEDAPETPPAAAAAPQQATPSAPQQAAPSATPSAPPPAPPPAPPRAADGPGATQTHAAGRAPAADPAPAPAPAPAAGEPGHAPAPALPPELPPELPYDSSIPVLLLRAREAMMRNFRPVLAAEGFTEQQWRVLRTLAADGPMDAAALSERSVILPPSLTRILHALEERGFLERRRDEADRRRTLCLLTETGRARVAELAPRTADVHARIEARFGPERSAELQKLLREIAGLD